jgi:hypothetical protein
VNERKRDYAQTLPMPPEAWNPAKCMRDGCGAAYLDSNEGRRAHNTVFGHYPPEVVSRVREGQ